MREPKPLSRRSREFLSEYRQARVPSVEELEEGLAQVESWAASNRPSVNTEPGGLSWGQALVLGGVGVLIVVLASRYAGSGAQAPEPAELGETCLSRVSQRLKAELEPFVSAVRAGPRGPVAGFVEDLSTQRDSNHSGEVMRPEPKDELGVQTRSAGTRVSGRSSPDIVARSTSRREQVPVEETKGVDTKADVQSELELIATARRQMAVGDFAAALSTLKRHEKFYRSGTFARERRVSVVTCLCRLGLASDGALTELRATHPAAAARFENGQCGDSK